jgi:predicted HD phosphohydrolase
MRDRYRDHPYWRDCAEFCAKYDQNCFDPDFDTLPLSHFEPLVHDLFKAPKRSIYLPQK